MPDSPHTNRELSQVQLETIRMLYPLFKNEVLRRREYMSRLSVFHNTILVFLIMILAVVSPGHPDFTMRWLTISGVVILSGFVVYLILQQATRHRMAKQQLIELERGMGLYQEAWMFSGKTTYPQHWQTDWLSDRSVATYLTILIVLTGLAIYAMLIRL
jgi:Ca2+/Na+ antiporter